jgi:hypothetical protein
MKTTKCLIIAVLAMITSCAFAQEVKEIPGWPKPGPEVPSACARSIPADGWIDIGGRRAWLGSKARISASSARTRLRE